MIDKPSDRVMSFWLVNGWIIVMLLVVVFLMAGFGFFDYFVSSGYGCDLGDSFTCKNFTAYTNEKTVSLGEIDDYISFMMTNVQNEPVKDLAVTIQSCSTANLINKTIMPGETVNVTSYFCDDMRPGYSMSARVNLTYNVISEGKEVNVQDFGHIDVFVESPQRESFVYKFKRWISNGLRKNIG